MKLKKIITILNLILFSIIKPIGKIELQSKKELPIIKEIFSNYLYTYKIKVLN